MNEKQLQAGVVDLAAMFGYRHFHNLYVPGSDRGWPDLVLVRGGPEPRIIFAELKGPRGVVSDDQTAWLVDLAEAGAEAYVWRPDIIEPDDDGCPLARVLRGARPAGRANAECMRG